ncbi:MAG: short-chain dehydrogenase [Cytophagaceae bacterium]|nr:short-chain dehydrogenase [Cytophagaceae bacterium]|tara:strand:- start:2087 stop:2875 length:789 start_codon:yes stop_codon:yes gene_type:complete
MDLGLKGKNALVCGSTAGIGKATALLMAKEGANVILLARNENKLKATLAELDTDTGQMHAMLAADFDNPQYVNAVVTEFLKKNGPVHILVNNSGGPAGGPILQADVSEFETALTRHLKCNHLLAQAIIPGMKEANYGRIINIISTSVKEPIPGLGVSNTTRWAVASWAKTLSNEVAESGITVNNVLPGATATARLSSLIEARAKKGGHSITEEENSWKNAIPMGRFANPGETANAIVFLASEPASYINGVSLAVDGGRLNSM